MYVFMGKLQWFRLKVVFVNLSLKGRSYILPRVYCELRIFSSCALNNQSSQYIFEEGTHKTVLKFQFDGKASNGVLVLFVHICMPLNLSVQMTHCTCKFLYYYTYVYTYVAIVISEPHDVTVCEGREAVLTCVLNSNIRSDDVQWYRFIKDTSTTEMVDPNEDDIYFITDTIGNTTSSSLTITNVIKSYTGYFWVVTPSLTVCNASLTVLTSM